MLEEGFFSCIISPLFFYFLFFLLYGALWRIFPLVTLLLSQYHLITINECHECLLDLSYCSFSRLSHVLSIEPRVSQP